MAVGDNSDDYTPITTVTICPDSALAKTMPRNECDPEDSNKEVEVLDADYNVFRLRTWDSLRVGDVCRIQSSQYFPADLLMIHSTSPMETAIDMTWYDGERELRLRQLNQVADPSIISRLGQGIVPGSVNAADIFRRSGTFVVTRPMPVMEKVTVNFIPSDGRDWLCFGSKQFLPFGSRLIMTDCIIGLVLFVGKETKYELNGGAESAKLRKTASQTPPKAPTSTSASSPRPIVPPVDAYLIERDTNILWSNQFQDVPDDGNCSMTAFWMGLKTLLQYYPHLKLTPYETLPITSPQFRASALDAIFADPNYITCLENQLQLWLELDAADLMSVVEDFFLLPENLQEYIIMVNQQCQGGGLPADMRILVDKYKEALTTSHIIGGREVFVPLGQLEMETLCELYQVRLQLIKSESVVQMGPLKNLDPRTIPACHILDKNPDCRRVVRLMNVNTNHYMVHLPRSPEF